MVSNVHRKTSEDHFWEVTPNNRRQKLHDNVLDKFGKIWAKNPLHLQKFACSYTYVYSSGFQPAGHD